MDCNLFALSPNEARVVFSGLKDQSWKQIFDGKWHHLGHLVFDQGKHGGPWEDGYYESICKAHQVIEEHLCEPLTINFYCQLHKIACAHFKGKENSTDCRSEEAGTFRKAHLLTHTSFKLKDLYFFYQTPLKKLPPTTWIDYGMIKAQPLIWHNNSEQERFDKLRNRAIISSNMSSQQLQDIESKVATAFDSLSRYLESSIQQFGEKRYPKISIQKSDLSIIYPSQDIETSLEAIFQDFNQKMLKCKDDRDAKLRLIADLYQKLEWLHPFIDGQGRVDLLLLSKLLSEHGFNPAILDEPYASSYVPLDDWCQYLSLGMEKWKTLKNQIDTKS